MFRCRLSDDAELRLFELRHAEELFAVTDRNRGYLREWLPWVDATHSAEDTRRFIRAALDQHAANAGFHAGMWRQERLAGTIGLHRIDWDNRAVSLGYWVDSAHQGKGLVTSGCRAVIDHIFQELRLNRIEIRCGVENRKSRAIPERLGFSQEGILRQAQYVAGRFIDLVVYSLLSSDRR